MSLVKVSILVTVEIVRAKDFNKAFTLFGSREIFDTFDKYTSANKSTYALLILFADSTDLFILIGQSPIVSLLIISSIETLWVSDFILSVFNKLPNDILLGSVDANRKKY
jgi:hypothetical protein